jgi:hypothetical protein
MPLFAYYIKTINVCRTAYGKVTMNEELEDMRKEKLVEMKKKIISYDSRSPDRYSNWGAQNTKQ